MPLQVEDLPVDHPLLSGTMVGTLEPRLWTRPLRPLTRATSLGYEVADFADRVLGQPLVPWQRWLVIHALELKPSGRPRFRTVLCLVARQNGKTNLSRTLALWHLYMRDAELVVGAAQDLSIALEVLELTNSTVEDCPALLAERESYIKANGKEAFRRRKGGKYIIKASNGKAGRGLTVDHLTMDEIREQRDWLAWASLSKTTSARPMAQIWCLSNAGDKASVVLNQLRTAAGVVPGKRGITEMSQDVQDAAIGLFEWSAPEGCELDDWDAIRQANPGLGYTVLEEAIRSSMVLDPPEVYRTEVLCQMVEQLNGAVDLDAWSACADATGSLRALRKRVALCVDASPDGKHVTAVAGAETPDGRYRIEVVGAWPSIEAAWGDLTEIVRGIAPFRIAWFPAGPVAPLRAELAKLGTTEDDRIFYASEPEIVELTGGQDSEACVSFAALVVGRRILHSDDDLMNAHISATRRLQSGNTWRFVRTGAGHIDAAYAAAGVVQVLRTAPAEREVASFAY